MQIILLTIIAKLKHISVSLFWLALVTLGPLLVATLPFPSLPIVFGISISSVQLNTRADRQWQHDWLVYLALGTVPVSACALSQNTTIE